MISIVPSSIGQEIINRKYLDPVMIIFTTDGTDPTLINHSQESPNSLSIS